MSPDEKTVRTKSCFIPLEVCCSLTLLSLDFYFPMKQTLFLEMSNFSNFLEMSKVNYHVHVVLKTKNSSDFI